MPAQHLAERTRDKLVSQFQQIPPNPSSQKLVKDGSLPEVDFFSGKKLRKGYMVGTKGDRSTSRWVTVTILVFVNLINYMDRLTLAGILEQVKSEFNANDAMMGLLQTAFIVSYMFFAPLFGYLGDRYSRKAILAAGVFLWAIFTVIGSFMYGREEHKAKKWGNPDFWSFLACRAMVGIGEASYSTIAPTIISDMFVKDMRSKVLALFYFAIPVGSGMGYIVGAKTAELAGSWQWGLRATPIAGLVAVLLIIFVLEDPPRGESEGNQHLKAQTYKEDLVSLGTNMSFLFSTLAFTCVTFCTGALSWWGPAYMEKALYTVQPELRAIEPSKVAFLFGAVTMVSGIIGVPLGMFLSTKLKPKYPRADPVICAAGILISAVFLTCGMLVCRYSIILAFIFLLIGEIALNLNWSIVADMLLYVVVPTCRSTAEAVQILFSHAFGDAGSPYLIGLVSDCLRELLDVTGKACHVADEPEAGSVVEASLVTDLMEADNGMSVRNATGTGMNAINYTDPCLQIDYSAMQYSLLTNTGVEVVGGVLFLITAIFIVKDKLKCEQYVTDSCNQTEPVEGAKLMLPELSPRLEFEYGEDEFDYEEDEAPQLISRERPAEEDTESSSRSTSPA